MSLITKFRPQKVPLPRKKIDLVYFYHQIKAQNLGTYETTKAAASADVCAALLVLPVQCRPSLVRNTRIDLPDVEEY